MTTRKQIQQWYMLMVVGLLFSVTGVRAVNYTWTGPATGGSWTQASNNWNAASTPIWDSVNGPGNNALFTNVVTATVGEAVYANNVTFTETPGIRLTNSPSFHTLTMNSGGWITLNDAVGGDKCYLHAPVAGSNVTFNINGSVGTAFEFFGTNNFTGQLSLKSTNAANYVTVLIRNAAALGTAKVLIDGYAKTVQDKGLFMQVASTVPVITNDISLAGGIGATGYGRIRLDAAVTFSGTITIVDDARVANDIGMITTAGDAVLSGPVVGTNASLRLGGGGGGAVGTVTLAAANSFSNLVIEAYKTAKLGHAGALNATPGQEAYITFDKNAYTVANIARLLLNGYGVTVSGLTNVWQTDTYKPVIENVNVTNVTFTIGNSLNRSSVFDGLVRDGTGGGKLSLAKAGTGTLTLLNTNQYTGATTVLAGTLTMTNAVKSATWAVSNSATLIVNGPLDLSTPSRALTIAAGGGTAGLLQVNGNLTLGGTLTVSAASEVTTQVTLAECTGGGTISGGVGSFVSTSLPTGTLLKVSDGSKALLLIMKPKGTMIRVF